MSNYRREEEYWETIRQQLLIIIEEFPGFPKPDLIMNTGDAVDGDFVEHLKAAMLGHMGRVPDILLDGPVVAAAKGAAGFMRRGPAPWSR